VAPAPAGRRAQGAEPAAPRRAQVSTCGFIERVLALGGDRRANVQRYMRTCK
jgi:hypothetical protein